MPACRFSLSGLHFSEIRFFFCEWIKLHKENEYGFSKWNIFLFYKGITEGSFTENCWKSWENFSFEYLIKRRGYFRIIRKKEAKASHYVKGIWFCFGPVIYFSSFFDSIKKLKLKALKRGKEKENNLQGVYRRI